MTPRPVRLRFERGKEGEVRIMLSPHPIVATAIGSPILGVIIPAAIFLVSFWVAWACYRHYARKKD